MAEKINNNKRIALIGNPNLGKTTLFNKLCGLRQKTGNYPGVTVDKKKGNLIAGDQIFEIIDLPGINSLYPKSQDEALVVDFLLQNNSEDFPDKIIVLASALNLNRSLYLFDQLRDLGLPLILAINLTDLAQKRGIEIDVEKLSIELDVPVVAISAKKNVGFQKLIELLDKPHVSADRPIHYLEEVEIPKLKAFPDSDSEYRKFLKLTRNPEQFQEFCTAQDIDPKKWKINESILRYKNIRTLVEKHVKVDKTKAVDFTTRADRVLVHPVFGYVIFIGIMLGIFQSIFWLAAFPMDWIDMTFSWLSEVTTSILPTGYFSDLITQGVIPGVGGVVIFVPQIAILFLLFSILEESGYMQRIVYLMDRFMQRFGMSGKSIVPMISGLACAIPAIMSARTIENNKERLITILTAPLMTCSARIPVYVVLIALVVPDDAYWGVFNLQGLWLMGMYLIGVVMTLMVAMILKLILKTEFKSFLVIDMPEYLQPDIKNVLYSAWTNSKAFVINAGKIILATSIILFVLATNGGENFKNVKDKVKTEYPDLSGDEQTTLISSMQLENSYLGVLGKSIEPAIQPLGYDWKIGIALISSLAAREVFVGTMSTIYAINSEEEMTVRDRLKGEVNSQGQPVFGFATSVSLLLFYAFALQCFSTIAVTYKETKSVKWVSIQFVYMTALAYFAAMIAYQLLK